MVHAYWQIPLHKDSQEAMSIQTPEGVFTPQRILQGSTDAGNHFQSVTSQAFMSLSESLLQWIDERSRFAVEFSTEKALSLIRETFKRCKI